MVIAEDYLARHARHETISEDCSHCINEVRAQREKIDKIDSLRNRLATSVHPELWRECVRAGIIQVA